MIASWQESCDKPRQCVEKQRHYSANKGPYSQGYGLPSGHIQLWKLDCKEGRMPKNWCLQTVVLEKTPESPLDNKEIKPVNLKGNQPWILTGWTDAKAETQVFWSPDVNSWLIGKDPNVGEDWEQDKRVSEDEMARWHHRCDKHELGQLREMVRDREDWHAAVQGVTKSQTRLSDLTFTFSFNTVLPMNIQGWFPLGLTGLISLQSKRLSRVFSSTTVWKHQFFSTWPSLWSNSYICM